MVVSLQFSEGVPEGGEIMHLILESFDDLRWIEGHVLLEMENVIKLYSIAGINQFQSSI